MHDACCPVYIYRCTQLDAIQSQVYLIADSMWHVIQGQKKHAVAMSGGLATMSGAVLPLSPWTRPVKQLGPAKLQNDELCMVSKAIQSYL